MHTLQLSSVFFRQEVFDLCCSSKVLSLDHVFNFSSEDAKTAGTKNRGKPRAIAKRGFPLSSHNPPANSKFLTKQHWQKKIRPDESALQTRMGNLPLHE